MTFSSATVRRLRRPLYFGGLALALFAILAGTLVHGEGFLDDVPAWTFLTLLFGVAESVPLLFHHGRGRQSLAAGEAVLLPMVVALSFSQVVWGVSGVIALVAVFYWRQSSEKTIFNIAQHGCAAAAASAVWIYLDDPTEVLSVRGAAAAALAVLIYAMLNHAFVAGAIAIVEGRRFTELVRDVASPAIPQLAASVSLGLVFAAAYLAQPWTAALFFLPLAAWYFGYRALLRQRTEGERVEGLHSASRALAASPDLGSALVEFLAAVTDVVSANEARVAILRKGQLLWTAVRSGDMTVVMEPVSEGPMVELFARVKMSDGAILVGEDNTGPLKALVSGLGARSLLAVPITDDEGVVGYIAALDRLGTDEFGESEARLLEALANELVLTLDSYRLFLEVTEERERFRRIFDGSKEGICLLDNRGVVLAWNPALESISGYPETEVIDQVWSDKVLVRDANQSRVAGMTLVEVSPEAELELVTRDGPTRWVAALAGPVGTGNDRRWVVLVRDRTAEHAAEEAKSDFLSTISHELRTPLTTIKGSLQVLSRTSAGLPPEMADQMIDVLRRGADRLERLVLNLLFVSQVEAGAVKIMFDEIAIEPLVRDAVERLAVAGRTHVIVPDFPVLVRADREKLAQSIEHLIDNAAKYGGPQGRITVEVAREPGYAHISVSDEGPGIPKAEHSRVFDRFVRLGDVLTREIQGAGVGLFIARESIHSMGGEIWVDADTDKGATLHVRLPLSRPVAVAEEADSA